MGRIFRPVPRVGGEPLFDDLQGPTGFASREIQLHEIVRQPIRRPDVVPTSRDGDHGTVLDQQFIGQILCTAV